MTPLFNGQFVWSQKCQKSYIPYLYNTDTSVKRTIGSVPLVSVLKRFDCTFQMASDLIHVIGKSRFGFRISQWNENSFSQTPPKFTQTQRRILVKKIHLRTGLQSTGYGTRFFWISCLNPIYPIDGTLSLFPHRSTNGHFFFPQWIFSLVSLQRPPDPFSMPLQRGSPVSGYARERQSGSFRSQKFGLNFSVRS